MQAHSVISNTISGDILKKGHLSVRFMVDGFSLLLKDQSFRPVILNKFQEKQALSLRTYVLECSEWLDRHTIFEGFEGETTIVYDKSASCLVPEKLFDPNQADAYLDPVGARDPDSYTMKYPLKGRKTMIVFDVAAILQSFAEKFKGKTRILPYTNLLYSVADQVNASDHQRGFALLEIQNYTMGILYIKEDRTVITNHMTVKNQDEVVYHTLNILSKKGFNRSKSPLFICGRMGDDIRETLSKYLGNIQPVPYLIPDIPKEAIPEHVLLSEASHCD